MLVTLSEILQKARREGYGVVAPSVRDGYGSIEGSIAAAEEMNSPVVLNIGTKAFPEDEIEFYLKLARMRGEKSKVPVAILHDHGRDFDHAMRFIRYGCTSVMVDRSSLDFEENIRQVSEIVKVAHACGLSVEAELGHVGIGLRYERDRDAGLTDPKEAKEYVERTGVDCLAVAIGTAHGVYKGEPHLDFERLAAITEIVDIPLVLHGGSGTGDENLAKACKMGISKVNIGRECHVSAARKIREVDLNVANTHPFNLVVDGFKDTVIHYMKLFGSVNKA